MRQEISSFPFASHSTMSHVPPLVSAATPTATLMATAIKENVLSSPFVVNALQIGQFYLSTELFRLMNRQLGEKLPEILAYMLRMQGKQVKTLYVPSTDSTYSKPNPILLGKAKTLSPVGGNSVDHDVDGESTNME
jgi:hypothetical protein